MIQNTNLAYILQLDADCQEVIAALQAANADANTLARLLSVQQRLAGIVTNESAATIANLQAENARLQAQLSNRR